MPAHFFMSSRLSTFLTRHVVENLAEGASFERGLDYFSRGKVTRLIEHGSTVMAKVSGTEHYEARLTAAADGLEFDCSCPVGVGGNFCKHCVAVALAWLEKRSRKTHGLEGSVEDPAPLVDLDDLRPWLLKQPPETLADLLLGAAEHDGRLREKLLRVTLRRGSTFRLTEPRSPERRKPTDSFPITRRSISPAASGMRSRRWRNC